MVVILIQPKNVFSLFFQRYLDGDELREDVPELTRVQTDDCIKLIVNEPTTDLSGEYLCRIINECGQAEAKARLTVNCNFFLLS